MMNGCHDCKRDMWGLCTDQRDRDKGCERWLSDNKHVINTPLELGQTVYYWANFFTVGGIKVSKAGGENPFGWHLEEEEIYGIRVTVHSNRDVEVEYFLHGRYMEDYSVFATKEEAMKKRPDVEEG